MRAAARGEDGTVSQVQHYKSNLRDIFFNLFEVLDVGRTTLGKGPFAAMDEESAKEALRGLEGLATNELATSFAETDRLGLTIDKEGNVALPDGLKRAMKAFHEG